MAVKKMATVQSGPSNMKMSETANARGHNECACSFGVKVPILVIDYRINMN